MHDKYMVLINSALKEELGAFLTVMSCTQHLCWDFSMSFPVDFKDTGQDRTFDMSRTCPRNSPKSWSLGENKILLVILYYFIAHAFFVRVWTVWKRTKKWKVQVFLDDGWCMGGYLCEGSTKLVIKCPDRTHCPCDLRTFYHVKDMSRTFPTKCNILMGRLEW